MKTGRLQKKWRVISASSFGYVSYSLSICAIMPCFNPNNAVCKAELKASHPVTSSCAYFTLRREINRRGILQFVFPPQPFPASAAVASVSLYHDEMLSVFYCRCRSAVIRRPSSASRPGAAQLDGRTDEGTQSDSALFYGRLSRQRRPAIRFHLTPACLI